MPRLPAPQYVINGVEFGHLDAEDIRAVSAAKITRQTTMNDYRKPNSGGLHDPRLGSFQSERCATCHKFSWHCDGHPGHIDLPVACYHPLYIDQILSLLRGQCAYCLKLQLPRVKIHLYTCRLRLLQHGLIQEMLHFENIQIRSSRTTSESTAESGLPSAQSGSDSANGKAPPAVEPEDDVEEDLDEYMKRRDKYVRQCIRRAKKEKDIPVVNFKNTITAEERRGVIKEFFSELHGIRKCPHCLGYPIAVRKETSTKFFRRALAEKQKDAMVQGGFEIPNPIVLIDEKRKLEKAMANGEEETGAEVEIARQKAVRSATKLDGMSDSFGARYLSPVEVYASLLLLVESEQELFNLLYTSRPGKRGNVSADMFFIRSLYVPANRYRPEAVVDKDRISEDSQNYLYIQILRYSDMIRAGRDEAKKGFKTVSQERRTQAQMTTSIIKLQEHVNQLIDKSKNPNATAPGVSSIDGIKQKLEKKEGLFRHNMMGKRVNYAARTVLAPDVYLETNEVGVPLVFAKKLVFPVPVTDRNYTEMKQYVINGYFKYPGAAIIENEHGKVLSLKAKSLDERIALANDLLAVSSDCRNTRPKIVHRHLISGDWVLMNRQPTLHKPSIMAHRARVIDSRHTESTFRMHYTNCNTYNADFDGDEMNMHFPQTVMTQSEASMIADTDHQYLSATSGKPLRGLIQDHISGGTWLTGKDTMFNTDEYMHLLCAALRPEDQHTTYNRILTVKPAIIRPKRLWTGKQVISTVLKNITPDDRQPLNTMGKSSTPASAWGENSEEGEVLIREGEFITGILDKAQLGAADGGLISCVHEIYGPTVTGKLIGILGRLITKFQNMRPFTCGLDDLFLTRDGESERRKRLQEADNIGFETHLKYVLLDKESEKQQQTELRKRLAGVFQQDEQQRGLDLVMNARTATLSSDVTAACMPKRLAKQFPKNGMQTMTISGAKGSQVNANLISCNLGQQVLEGRRVPVMPSGKTLPCYRPFETRPIAGGYIASRFLTGVRPQEYFFHAMAGREGLIDTAVKTSRSGYLQRCLVKGMEGLKVEYDGTVRDSDTSIVQFLYGEDGLEVTKAKSFTKLPLLAHNHESVSYEANSRNGLDLIETGYSDIIKENKMAERGWRKANNLGATDPIISKYNPQTRIGAVSETFFKSVGKFLDEDPEKLVRSRENPNGKFKKLLFRGLMDLKYMQSLVEPGEAVGVVAAQSVGEPSTQMTLNTFHLAGHSAKNVTLGIPRLREIVMTASAQIKTPVMTLTIHSDLEPGDGVRFSRQISKYTLAECIDAVAIRESARKSREGASARIYDIFIKFYPAKQYEVEYEITRHQILECIEKKFIPTLISVTRQDKKKKRKERSGKSTADISKPVSSVFDQEKAARSAERAQDSDASDEEDQDDDPENDAKAATRLANRKAGQGYDDADEEEEEELRELEDIQTSTESETDETQSEQTLSESEGSDDEREPAHPSRKKRGSLAPETKSSSSEENIKYLALGDRSEAAVEFERNICSEYEEISRFRFDTNGGWASLRLSYGDKSPKFLMMPHIETASKRAVVTEIPNLGKCQFLKEKKYDVATKTDTEVCTIVTEGVNLDVIRDWQHMINPNTLSTNDIAYMLKCYGVEAARATIVSELMAIFQSHGISVDPRHLNLIADTMTRGGCFTPFSRNGLKRASTSPLMKMSFETTFGFLKDALDAQDWDELNSPSSRIVVGKADRQGTGSFSVLNRIDEEYLQAAKTHFKTSSKKRERQDGPVRLGDWYEYEELLDRPPATLPSVREKQRKMKGATATDQFRNYQSDQSSPSGSDVGILMSTPELEFYSPSPEPELQPLQSEDLTAEAIPRLEEDRGAKEQMSPFDDLDQHRPDVSMDDADTSPQTLNEREDISPQTHGTYGGSVTPDAEPQFTNGAHPSHDTSSDKSDAETSDPRPSRNSENGNNAGNTFMANRASHRDESTRDEHHGSEDGDHTSQEDDEASDGDEDQQPTTNNTISQDLTTSSPRNLSSITQSQQQEDRSSQTSLGTRARNIFGWLYS